MARRRKPTGSPGYIPPKERREAVNKAADRKLDRFVRNNPEGDRRNTEESPIQDVVRDMPKKFQSKFKGIENYDDMNQAQKALFGFYDNRNKYQRDMNTLRTSSPQMMDAYARRFPISNFAMKAGPMIAGVATGVPFGLMDLLNKGRNKFTNLSDRDDILGAIARTTNDIASSFTPEQAKNIDTNIETKKPIDKVLRDENIINASTSETREDVDPILRAAAAQTGSEDIVDIFDNDGEKAAIEAALTPGTVFDPVAADKQSKVDFINQVENTNFTVERAEQRFNIDEQFERSKQKQGGIIREEVNRDLNVDDEDPIPGGQFNLTRPTVNEDTVSVILGGAGPDYDYGDFMVNEDLGNVIPTDNIFPEGGVSGTPVTQAGQELVFSDGTPVTQPVNTGLDMVGDKAFPNSPGSQTALDIFNSNATDGGFSGYPTMRFNEGGSTNKYENMSTHEKLMRMAAEMYG